MTRFEILVEVNGFVDGYPRLVVQQLDTYNEEPISLTYNVADVNDISSRNSSFSKTIKLPETRNNRSVFGDIADLGVNSSFNPNKKTKAWILVDTAVIFEGYIQLRKVIINKETEQGDYEVVIYADNDNFYKQLGDGFISDIDFSELDHTWNKTNIISSFTASYNNGYYYPLIDYGQDWDLGEINGWTNAYNTQVKVGDMYPATNVRYIFDKIFSLAGYSYKSDFLTGDIFENLYIPFNKTALTRDVNTSTGRFTVGFTQSLVYYNNTSRTTARVINAGPGGTIANPHAVSLGLTDDRFHIPFNYEGSPNGDPDNLYNFDGYSPNVDTFYYQAPVDFISEQFICNFDIRFPYGIDYAGLKYGTSTPLATICFRRSRDPITGVTVSGGLGSVVPIGGSLSPKRFLAADISGITYLETGSGYTPTGGKRVIGQISCDLLNGTTAINTRKLYQGEKLWVEVKYSVPANSLRAQAGMVDATSGVTPVWNMPISSGSNYPLITFNSSTNFYNSLSSVITKDEYLTYNSAIPSNVKKKDFINSIIKMFNLYVEPSKDYPKTLIIEPRDNYYKSGLFKDWTRKLNTNSNIEEQILGETQNKLTTFKYKDDKDFFNVDYTTTTGGLSYGEYNYYIDNDFTTGEKKIELIFSPTPIVGVRIPNSTAYSQIIIPKIVKVQQDQAQPLTDSNIRILTRKYSSTKSSWIYGDYQFNSSGFYNSYVKLTSSGFGNAVHSFIVGDYIRVAQSDGGVAHPLLQANFKVVEVVNNKTIVIDIPFASIGSGAALGGTCYPLDGLLGVDDSSSWNFEGTRFRAYPYLGHLDNPQYPTYDINFGQTIGLYYPQNTFPTTNNNLFNIYWENLINELSDRDSRIITAEFYLTPFDIADFRFNDNIFIRDQYYKVNKITNYDPTKEALVKVELIKSQYISVPRNTRVFVNNVGLGNVGLSNIGQLRPYVGAGGSITTTGNIPTASGSIISGRDNIGSGLIVGRNNSVNAVNTMTIGNNNILNQNTDNSIVIGSNNTLDPGTNNLPKFVLGSSNSHSGDGLVIGESNTIGLGNMNINLFGSNNTVPSPLIQEIAASYSVLTSSNASKNIFVIGSSNTISSPTFSSILDVFILGTGSTVGSPNVSLFGSRAIIGTNSSGSYIVGDDVSLNTPNTFYVNKDTTIINSPTLEVASKTTFTDSVRIIDTINNTQPVVGSGFSSFLKLADFPIVAGDFSGETIEGLANNASSSGQIGYLDSFGKWLIATSDELYTSVEGGSQLGVIIHSTSGEEATTLLLSGFYSPGNYLQEETGFAIGQPLYIAPSTVGQGFITNLAPSGIGNVVRVIGYLHNNASPYTVRFSPDTTWIEID